MELFEFTETAKILLEMAEEVRKVYKEKLQLSDRIASGDLERSIQTEVRIDGTTYAVMMQLKDYWEFVENDTLPHWPPVDAIRKWIFIKPVIPRPDSRGKTPSPESLAYLIGRKISKVGTTGTHDLENTKSEVIPKYLERLKEAIGHDAENYIRKVMIGA